MIGVPDSVIAATMIAIGTSLPELVTTITAIRKKQSSLSVGNIIGANIMDLTLIMPLCALLQGQAPRRRKSGHAAGCSGLPYRQRRSYGSGARVRQVQALDRRAHRRAVYSVSCNNVHLLRRVRYKID